MTDTNRTRYTNWQTIGFTALTGWINVFKDDDGAVLNEPCPGVLIQEATTSEVMWNEVRGDHLEVRSRTEEIERCTRAIFATREGRELVAIEYDDDSYVRSELEAKDSEI